MADRTNLTLEAPSEAAEGVDSAPVAASGGIKAFLPLILTAVLMPVLAWTMTNFVLVPKLQKSLGITPAPHAEKTEGEGHEAPAAEGGHGEAGGHGESGGHGEKGGGKEKGSAKETASMTKLLVNVSGTMGSRYLLTSLTLAGNGSDFKSKVQKNEAKLRDTACTMLATKTITDLEKPGARNLVRSELINGFNNILGANTVQEMYITEFAIQ